MNAFDCREMMHEGQEELHRKLDGMTAQERREYWRRRTEDLRQLQQQTRIKQRHAQALEELNASRPTATPRE